MGKFDKNKNCLYCEVEMEAVYRSKMFCSDKCRVYYNRENPKHKKQVTFKDFVEKQPDTPKVTEQKTEELTSFQRLQKERLEGKPKK